MTEDGSSVPYHKKMCTGCGKVIDGRPNGPCTDCGGRWKTPTREDLSCDRCGDRGASRVFNSDHDRLCDDCIDYENRDNPECPDCGRRMLPDGPESWECPDCWKPAKEEAT